jgi:hypothetical protein
VLEGGAITCTRRGGLEIIARSFKAGRLLIGFGLNGRPIQDFHDGFFCNRPWSRPSYSFGCSFRATYSDLKPRPADLAYDL